MSLTLIMAQDYLTWKPANIGLSGHNDLSINGSPVTRLRAQLSCLTMLGEKFTVGPTPKRKQGQSDWTLLSLRRWRGLECPFRVGLVIGNNEFGSQRRVTGEQRRCRRRRDHVLGQYGRHRPDAPELIRWAGAETFWAEPCLLYI